MDVYCIKSSTKVIFTSKSPKAKLLMSCEFFDVLYDNEKNAVLYRNLEFYEEIMKYFKDHGLEVEVK